MTLENKVDELERKCRTQQEQIYELKEQLTHNQADLKLKTAHFEGKVSVLYYLKAILLWPFSSSKNFFV